MRRALALLLALPALACNTDDVMQGSEEGPPRDGTPIADAAGLISDGSAALDGALGPGSDGAIAPGSDGAATSCLGSDLLAALGRDRLLVGGAMEDATAASAPITARYVYIAGAFPDGSGPCTSCATGCTSQGHSCANAAGGCGWWGCWQYDQDPPGAYVRNFVATENAAGHVPMFSYYVILQSSGVQEGAPEVTVTDDATYMARYYDEWRFFLQQIGSSVALIQIEPDFWGYAEQVNADPHQIASAVATANPTDCATEENTIAGMGRCLVAMVRKYAPRAKVGLHASAWGSKIDVYLNTDPTLDVAGEARKVASFLAAAGESDADFVVVEASDRDAGYYQSLGRNTWWDASNATLPDFHQHLTWVQALTEALGKPALHWQLPLGNASQNDTTNHWKDNRVDYYFAHPSEVAAAHSIGLLFGAGAGDQTTPESDGGNFVAKLQAYQASGGQPLCP